jgi:NAD(P)-dependent dehydrogenase (short-subunit alcohol dehydrogenase family)
MTLTQTVRYASLKGAVAMVTGGASGIGRGIVVALAGQGARVAFLDRDRDAAAETLAACPRTLTPWPPACRRLRPNWDRSASW